jgi:hypothetical protein
MELPLDDLCRVLGRAIRHRNAECNPGRQALEDKPWPGDQTGDPLACVSAVQELVTSGVSLSSDGSTPYAAPIWTDEGEDSPRKALKHRARNESRTVPACPQLVTHLRAHVDEFGTGKNGRLFIRADGGTVCYATFASVWSRTREAVLSPAQFASPLAKRPYDLRHACVSTWLNAGVAASQVAEWAGHSVEMLLSTYAKCIDGQEELARKRIEEALEWTEPEVEPDA